MLELEMIVSELVVFLNETQSLLLFINIQKSTIYGIKNGIILINLKDLSIN